MRETERLHEVGYIGNGEGPLQCPAINQSRELHLDCLRLRDPTLKNHSQLQPWSKWSFSVHTVSLLSQDSEIWAIRVKQLIGLLACLTWFVQYYLLLDTDFFQLFRKSRERSAAVKLCSAELKGHDIVRAFRRLNVLALVLSLKPPQIQLNGLEKISILLYTLVCLIHWTWNVVMFFALFYRQIWWFRSMGWQFPKRRKWWQWQQW